LYFYLFGVLGDIKTGHAGLLECGLLVGNLGKKKRVCLNNVKPYKIHLQYIK